MQCAADGINAFMGIILWGSFCSMSFVFFFFINKASLTVTGLRCERLSGGNSLVLVWDSPSDQWAGVEVQMKGRNPQYLNGTRLELHDLYPAFWYNMTLKLYSGDVKSAPVSISCQTDPRGEVFTTFKNIELIWETCVMNKYASFKQDMAPYFWQCYSF